MGLAESNQSEIDAWTGEDEVGKPLDLLMDLDRFIKAACPDEDDEHADRIPVDRTENTPG